MNNGSEQRCECGHEKKEHSLYNGLIGAGMCCPARGDCECTEFALASHPESVTQEDKVCSCGHSATRHLRGTQGCGDIECPCDGFQPAPVIETKVDAAKRKVLERWPDAVNTLVSDGLIKVWSSSPHASYNWIELGYGKDVYSAWIAAAAHESVTQGEKGGFTAKANHMGERERGDCEGCNDSICPCNAPISCDECEGPMEWKLTCAHCGSLAENRELKELLREKNIRLESTSFTYEVPDRYRKQRSAFDAGYGSGWCERKYDNPYTSGHHRDAYRAGYDIANQTVLLRMSKAAVTGE